MENNNTERKSSLRKYGRHSLSYLTLSHKLDAITGEWKGYIGFKNLFKTSIILGDPIVPNEDLNMAIADLKETQIKQKNHICFFINSKYIIKNLMQHDFKGFLVGHEAIVTLSKFTTSGRKKWSLRSSIKNANKRHLKIEEYKIKKKRSPDIENQLHEITNEWCKIKKMPELTFAFGHIDFNTFKDARVFICKKNQRIEGFLVYFPIYYSNSYYLDLSRRRINAPNGTIDFLFVKSFEILKKEGIKKIYIGYSPILSNKITNFNTKCGGIFFKMLKPFLTFFYPAIKEYNFKKKYATEWEPNYFFYYPRISIRMLFGLVHAIYSGGIGGIIFTKLKYILLDNKSNQKHQ
jgi:phosphatidylglycerol lysyltransferase